MNHKLGESVESYCEANLFNFDKIEKKNCRIHRWFYEPRTKELLCICNVSDATDKDGRLLMGDEDSRGVLLISENKFKEYGDIQQGSFSYALEIWTESDVYQTARNLFRPLAHNQTQVLCDPIPSQNHTYSCVVVHYNNEKVTWDYPENWISPTRYLRNIFYDESNITVQVVGIHWPPKDSVDGGQFHIDTVVAGEEETPDFCRLFSEKIEKDSLQYLMKCHVEFIDSAATIQGKKIAKLNLIMKLKNFIWKTNARRALIVANLWKRIQEHCVFPVYIREDNASYVPSHTTTLDKDFDLRVAYEDAAIPKSFGGRKQRAKMCDRLTEFSNKTIKTCNVTESHYGYGVASVSVGSKEASVYEVQLQLMNRLNSYNTKRCLFNVTPNPITKGY